MVLLPLTYHDCIEIICFPYFCGDLMVDVAFSSPRGRLHCEVAMHCWRFHLAAAGHFIDFGLVLWTPAACAQGDSSPVSCP